MGIIESHYYKIPVIKLGNRQKGRVHAKNVEFVRKVDSNKAEWFY